MDSTKNIASSTSAADSALPVAEDSKNAGEEEKSQVEAATENRNINGKEGENGSNILEKKDRSGSDVADDESKHRISINTALVGKSERLDLQLDGGSDDRNLNACPCPNYKGMKSPYKFENPDDVDDSLPHNLGGTSSQNEGEGQNDVDDSLPHNFEGTSSQNADEDTSTQLANSSVTEDSTVQSFVNSDQLTDSEVESDESPQLQAENKVPSVAGDPGVDGEFGGTEESLKSENQPSDYTDEPEVEGDRSLADPLAIDDEALGVDVASVAGVGEPGIGSEDDVLATSEGADVSDQLADATNFNQDSSLTVNDTINEAGANDDGQQVADLDLKLEDTQQLADETGLASPLDEDQAKPETGLSDSPMSENESEQGGRLSATHKDEAQSGQEGGSSEAPLIEDLTEDGLIQNQVEAEEGSAPLSDEALSGQEGGSSESPLNEDLTEDGLTQNQVGGEEASASISDEAESGQEGGSSESPRIEDLTEDGLTQNQVGGEEASASISDEAESGQEGGSSESPRIEDLTEDGLTQNQVGGEEASAPLSDGDQDNAQDSAVDREFASSSGSNELDETTANQAEDPTNQSVDTEISGEPANGNLPVPTVNEEGGKAGIGSAKTVENRCGECNEELGREDPRTIYKQTAYHPRCFTCFECKSEKLSGLNGFYVNGGRRYCVDCYNMHVAERCTNCNEAILEGGVRHRSRPFHHKCFKCAGCDAVLGKTPFVWRDQRTLCLPCYTEKFAEKCFKCSATIQPGEQYLQVEGKHFHDQCLVCDICQDQLLDNPFVQDGERNVCVNCSTNGFSSYKLKDSPATAENPATTEESPSPAPARESHRDSSGMDIKDWISKPKESNKNSADLSATPHQPTNVAVPVAEAAEVAAEAAPEPVVEAAPEPEVEAAPEPEVEAAPEPVEDTTTDNAESEEADDGN